MSNTSKYYDLFVASKVKPGGAILMEATPAKMHITHMAIGVCTEAGELLDAVKKHLCYGKELDRTNMIEELGDLEFYMEALRQAIRVSRDEVLQANIDKLSKRYKASFTNEEAEARADKNDG